MSPSMLVVQVIYNEVISVMTHHKKGGQNVVVAVYVYVIYIECKIQNFPNLVTHTYLSVFVLLPPYSDKTVFLPPSFST